MAGVALRVRLPPRVLHPGGEAALRLLHAPVLWGDTFVGRVDAKADRRARELLVRHVWFEQAFRDFTGVADPLARTLHRFAAFNGCDRVRLGSVVPRQGSGAC